MGNELNAVVDGLKALEQATQTHYPDPDPESYECGQCGYVNQTIQPSDICEHCHTTNILLRTEVVFTIPSIPCNNRDRTEEMVNLRIPYLSSLTIKDIMRTVVAVLNSKYKPLIFQVRSISPLMKKSFCPKAKEWKLDWEQHCSKSITDYSISDIIEKGLALKMINRLILNHTRNKIGCKFMINMLDEEKKDAMDPSTCHIYREMINNYKFSEEALQHLDQCNHFEDEYESKPKCKYGQKCKSFLRLEQGGHRLDDRCHIKLYNHPPRNRRQISMAENLNAFTVNTKNKQCKPVLQPLGQEIKDKHQFNDTEGFILALIEEVIHNGYRYDLCLHCAANDHCNHNDYSILNVVDDKLQHIRHQQMGRPLRRDHMSALILYTGCDCNYDMCAAQRNGDYEKWKWFDYCLYHAVGLLSVKERTTFKVFSGLNKVQFNKRHLEMGYFPTYTSASWVKDVSKQFMGNEGMIIEIDEKYVNDEFTRRCDVSWISKFPDECEILFRRNNYHGYDGQGTFKLSILDQKSGIQTISMKKSDRKK